MARIKTQHGIEVIVDGEMKKKLKDHFVSEMILIRCTRRDMKRDETRLLHHIVLGINKVPPGKVVDHINGNPLDCRRGNLRLCTQAENIHNCGPQHGKKYKGVHLERYRSGRYRWVANIRSKEHRWVQYFVKEKDAVRAYNAKAKEYFGEYARLNRWRGPSRKLRAWQVASKKRGIYCHLPKCRCLVCERVRQARQRKIKDQKAKNKMTNKKVAKVKKFTTGKQRTDEKIEEKIC